VEFQVNRLVFVADSVKYTIRDMAGLLRALTPQRITDIWADDVVMGGEDGFDNWADAVEAEEAQLKYSNPLQWLQDRASMRSIAPEGRIPGQRPVGLRILGPSTVGRVPPTIPKEPRVIPQRSVGVGDARARARVRLDHYKRYGQWPEEESEFNWSDDRSEASSRDYEDWE